MKTSKFHNIYTYRKVPSCESSVEVGLLRGLLRGLLTASNFEIRRSTNVTLILAFSPDSRQSYSFRLPALIYIFL